MNIESIKTTEDAIEFAKEEFRRRGISWNNYELDYVREITDETIAKLKLKDRQPGWGFTQIYVNLGRLL